MQKKHMNEYNYKNYLQKCPKCGCPLSDKDYDCPACGVNLVGYNEEQNRADNLTAYADEFEKLANKSEALNKKIRREKIKNNTIKNKRNTFLKNLYSWAIAGALILGIVSCVVWTIQDISNKVKSKSYDEVVQSFEEFEDDPILINDRSLNTWDVVKELSCDVDGYVIDVQQGYDSKTGTTFIRETCIDDKNSERSFSVVKILNNDIAHLPVIDTQFGYIDYDGAISDFEETFIETESGLTADEYIVSEYVFEKNNIIEKLPTLIINETKINMYMIDTYKNSKRPCKIIGIIEVDDSLIYESKMYVSNKSNINTILNSIDDYFYIYKESGVLKDE